MMKGSCKRPMNITMLDSDDTVYCIGITRAGAFLPVCLSIGTERKVLMLDSDNVAKGYELIRASLPGIKLDVVLTTKAACIELNGDYRGDCLMIEGARR